MGTCRSRSPAQGGGSRGVGVWGSETASGSTPRALGWPLSCSQLSRPGGQYQVLQNGEHCVGCCQGRQDPTPALTPGPGEDVQRERPARQLRLVYSRHPLLLLLLPDRGLRCRALPFLTCLGELAVLSRQPPVTSTLPLLSSVAEWKPRAVAREPVEVQPPVAGSYTSTALRQLVPRHSSPPSTTPPFGMRPGAVVLTARSRALP